MEKTIRVRVIKASSPSYWYSNSIGAEFDVMDVPFAHSESFRDWWLYIGYGYILKDDCEVVLVEQKLNGVNMASNPHSPFVSEKYGEVVIDKSDISRSERIEIKVDGQTYFINRKAWEVEKQLRKLRNQLYENEISQDVYDLCIKSIIPTLI